MYIATRIHSITSYLCIPKLLAEKKDPNLNPNEMTSIVLIYESNWINKETGL